MKCHALTVCLGIGAALAFASIGANALAATIKVKINDVAFDPAVVFAHPGDVIEWQNGDFIDHTATARNGQWDITLPMGATRRLKLTRPGELPYFCKFHPGMRGTIHVTGP
ncbi:cupredoxin domain-containing protein [Labrys okinawensis]|uniref:cupredoxin domain-containing protein n=1 Tax=Labrys okinawensis TaxID=346911 RepID=UPI0039BCFDEE